MCCSIRYCAVLVYDGAIEKAKWKRIVTDVTFYVDLPVCMLLQPDDSIDLVIPGLL